MFTSDLLKQGAQSSTTTVANTTGTTTINYTPTTPVEILILSNTNAGTLTLNGLFVFSIAAGGEKNYKYNAGAGQAQAFALNAVSGQVLITARKID